VRCKIAHPVEQGEIGIAADRREADQLADQRQRGQVIEVRNRRGFDGAQCGGGFGGVHR
jgi:hypothetical protein